MREAERLARGDLARRSRYPAPIRRFVFDGVPLVPVVPLPFLRVREERWHLPDSTETKEVIRAAAQRGCTLEFRRRTATAKELFARARKLGVSAYLFVRKEEIET